MKKTKYVLISLVSIPFLTLALLFFIAAASNGSRILVALAFAAIGVAILVTGLRGMRRLASLDPEVLRTGAINLAQRLGGELTASQLRAEYNIPLDAAMDVLIGLENEGSCRREDREDRTVYVFSGLLPSMAEKVCPYCNTQLPVRSALRKCPNCGAQLEIEKT